MKIKRHKHVQRVITFYKSNFGFKPPYNILIDGTFCKAALSFQVNISEQMPKYLEAEVKLFTTACVKAECEAFGTYLYGPWKVLQQFEEKPCGHSTPVPASKCLYRLLKRKKNKSKFMLATQDPELSEIIRARAGIPLLYISHKAINLEQQSEKSQEVANQKLGNRLEPADFQKETIKKLKAVELGEQEEKPRKRKRKVLSGPNPLSCQKKKRKVETPSGTFTVSASGETTRKKKRGRHKRKKHHGQATVAE